MKKLLAACSPATFGKGQQEVLDPSYRLALQLPPSAFATSFHPSDYGILDEVSPSLFLLSHPLLPLSTHAPLLSVVSRKFYRYKGFFFLRKLKYVQSCICSMPTQ